MEFTSVGKVCSFCGLIGDKDTRFAGGLGAMMCRDCLDYYHQVFSSEESVEEIRVPVWETMSDTEMLSRLPLISMTSDQVGKFLRDWVALIRARGISWAEIGKALGVSRQAAWERFSEASPARKSNVTA
ncbi:AsnC family protein [Marmoricola sp. RAF53]|uniref:AsnC family protein n=1 Tax=Marmoricola sp. RAF53 TaxID=3233059 RepID=UPI003F9DC94D